MTKKLKRVQGNPKRFAELRRILRSKDIDQILLADELGRCTAYISQRMTNKADWDLQDMYKILELINYPAEQLSRLFPPEGVKLSAGCTVPPMNGYAPSAPPILKLDGREYRLTEVGK